MNAYQKIYDLFSCIPAISKWEDAYSLFGNITHEQPYQWSLPLVACQAVGGSTDRAIPMALAIACCHISIILVDDMLDSDPRGQFHRIGMPAASNLAGAFQAAALEAVSMSELNIHRKLRVMGQIKEMMLTTTYGQYLDTHAPVDEEAYWQIVKTKSSPFFGASLMIGGLAGGCTIKAANQLRELGWLYGEMIQIHDDLNDVMELPANPDWTERRSPLPILFARLVDYPQRRRFIELCEKITDEEALREAQNILIRSGAVSFCIDQLLKRYQKARTILDKTELMNPDIVEKLVEEAIAPVEKLFQAIGEPAPTMRTNY